MDRRRRPEDVAEAAVAGRRCGAGGERGWCSCGQLLELVRGEGGAQHREAAGDLGLDGALGSPEDLGELGVRQVVDVPQHHGDAVPVGEGGEEPARRSRSSVIAAMRAGSVASLAAGSRPASTSGSRGVVGTGWRRTRLRHRLTTIVASQARSRSSRIRCGS